MYLTSCSAFAINMSSHYNFFPVYNPSRIITMLSPFPSCHLRTTTFLPVYQSICFCQVSYDMLMFMKMRCRVIVKNTSFFSFDKINIIFQEMPLAY